MGEISGGPILLSPLFKDFFKPKPKLSMRESHASETSVKMGVGMAHPLALPTLEHLQADLRGKEAATACGRSDLLQLATCSRRRLRI